MAGEKERVEKENTKANIKMAKKANCKSTLQCQIGKQESNRRKQIQTNKQTNRKQLKKITTKQRQICNNKSKMSLVGRRESSKGSAVGKYGRRGQKRRAAKSGNAK